MTAACHLWLSRLGFHNASNVGGSAYANSSGDSLKPPSDFNRPSCAIARAGCQPVASRYWGASPQLR